MPEKIKKIVSVAIIYFAVLSLFLIFDTQSAFAICDRHEGISSAFYKVKKVIIYIDFRQSSPREQLKNFPNEIKSDNFKSLVRKIVEDNFSVCSSIVSLSGPAEQVGSGIPEVYNPDNLTIRIKPSYADALIKGMPESAVVSVDISFFRPGLEPADAFAVLGMSKTLFFQPNMTDTRPFSEKLKATLSGVLTPKVYGFNGLLLRAQ